MDRYGSRHPLLSLLPNHSPNRVLCFINLHATLLCKEIIILYTTPWSDSMCHLGDKFMSLQHSTKSCITSWPLSFLPFSLASLMCLKQAWGLLLQTYSLTGIPFPRHPINSHVFITSLTSHIGPEVFPTADAILHNGSHIPTCMHTSDTSPPLLPALIATQHTIPLMYSCIYYYWMSPLIRM